MSFRVGKIARGGGALSGKVGMVGKGEYCLGGLGEVQFLEWWAWWEGGRHVVRDEIVDEGERRDDGRG